MWLGSLTILGFSRRLRTTLVALAVLAGCSGGDADSVLLDCSGGTGRCIERKPEGPLGDVRYITDPQNLIDGPFTSERFDVEFLDLLLRRPWDLEFLPDGSMLVTQRTGRIVHIENRNQLPAYEVKPVVLSLTGLLGLAVDPDFETNRYVYIYYSHARGESLPEERDEEGSLRTQVVNKISRLTMGRHSLFREMTILDDIPGSSAHSGGRLEFGPDGKLYATTGDASTPERSQDLSFLGGKILRINPDGSVPADNPIPGSPVYSSGHRNPQGLAWNPLTGEMFASEHGPLRMDEINRIQPGRNYGWGTFECRRPTGKMPALGPVTFPVVCFNRYTMAPSGMHFVSDPESPWYGSLFLCGLRGAHLRRLEFEGGRVAREEIFFVAEGRDYLHSDAASLGPRGLDARFRDVEYHAGSLYVIGDRFGIARITPR